MGIKFLNERTKGTSGASGSGLKVEQLCYESTTLYERPKVLRENRCVKINYGSMNYVCHAYTYTIHDTFYK